MQQVGQQILDQQLNLKAKYAQYENVLKGAKKGEVCTRFPPEPSGYLHIGHIKAAILNFHYSKIYEGKMIMRFDDTNPSKEKIEFVDSILEDLHTLGITWDKQSYSSDYFVQAEEYARQLIKDQLAYCDNTPVEKMREERFKQIESACRALSVEENLALFQGMLTGEKADYCLRAKIDMKELNGCMRDPVLYRVNMTPHHRTGTKFKAYPTYDFVCPIIDSLEGVTHAMRTNEYSDRIDQYNWMINALKLRPVEIYEFSRLNLVNTCLSKRKLQEFVNEKIVDGWDDPRFPTLRGIIRRGIRVETLTDFMLEQGPSKNANLMQWDKLWSTNIKYIDPISPRFVAVGKDNVAELTIVNWQGKAVDVVTVPMHQKVPELGDRPLFRSATLLIEEEDAKSFKVDEKITLMKWGNVKVLSIEENQMTNGIKLTAEDLPDDKDFKGTKKITWLAKDAPCVNVELVEYDHLIRVKKVEEQMSFNDIVNPNSKFVTQAIGDPALKQLKVGDFLQFERRGFFRIDDIRGHDNEITYVAFFVPDGKTKGLASIATKVDQVTVSQGKQEIESKSKAKKQEKAKKPEKQEEPPKAE